MSYYTTHYKCIVKCQIFVPETFNYSVVLFYQRFMSDVNIFGYCEEILQWLMHFSIQNKNFEISQP